MTTELTQPQTDLEPVPAIGQGQSQGHRRRRRRRKNKSSQKARPRPSWASHTSGATSGTTSDASAAAAAGGGCARPESPESPGPGAEEEEVFPEESAPAAQPGNSVYAPSQGSSQGKRKNRQKGPREFVGQWITAIARSMATWPTVLPPRFKLQATTATAAITRTSIDAGAGSGPRRRPYAHLLLH